ncbi:MAG: thiol reductant ABC exporter subunit CydC [Gammaproteobacteria bacterium]|jgi:ATP-binding cassette subfamily C protein CydC|nr:thiol reductant ABC exporter subunit CydC [Gammaproteobacteria bacterium]
MKRVRLRDLTRSRPGAWLLAALLGAVTVFSVTGLLATSGWFITAAALAGLLSGAAGYGFDVFRPAAIIRFFAIARTAGRYTERLASHNAVLGLLRDLRVQLFSHIAHLRSDPRRWRSAHVLQRLVTDIDLLDRFPLQVLLPWLWAGLLLAGVSTLLALLDLRLLVVSSLLALAWLLPLIGWRLGARLAEAAGQAQQQRREYLLDNLRLLSDLLVWQHWEHRRLGFDELDQACQQLEWRQQRLTAWVGLGQQLLLGLATLWLLIVGAGLVRGQELELAWLLATLLALFGLGETLAPLAGTVVALGMSRTARDRINSTLDEAQTPSEHVAEQPVAPWHLQLQGVSCRRPGALTGPQDIQLELHSGEQLWIKGPSGAGKSTLLDLLAGALAPEQGSCLLNGQPLESWDLRWVIGYLHQQIDLFDLSLAANLRLGAPQASDARLWQVLEDVALADWARERGLDTPLGEQGSAVSGGQARRIALARLLLAERPILLLDEPFAGLDTATREHIMQALLRRQRDGLLVIASHQPVSAERLCTLRIG